MSDRLDARIRELTFRLIEMSPEAPPFPEETMVQLRPPSTVTTPPRRQTRLAWALAAAVAVIAGIAIPAFLLGGSSDDVVDVTTVTQPDQTPTTVTQPDQTTTPSTSPPAGLDLSGASWVTHGLDGIRLDDGTLLWETQPFPAGIARDQEGGFAFADSTGLWWFASGAEEPALVREGVFDLVAVIPDAQGPVALVGDAGPVYVRLSDGEPVADPGGGPVAVSADTPWLRKWVAPNGLSAWVVEPVVEFDAEGQPAAVREPAHLVVARDDETLLDLPIGTEQEPWATLRDFDGRTLIVSRGPFEPAMPPETFFVIDLSCGDCLRTFTADGTDATLSGSDVDWTGPVEAPQLAGSTVRSFTIDPAAVTPVDLAPAGVTSTGWGNGEFELGLSDQGSGPCCFDVTSQGGVVFLDAQHQRLMHWIPEGGSVFPLATFQPAEFVADAVAIGPDDRIYVLGVSNRPGPVHDLLIIGLDGSVEGPFETVVESNADLQATANGIYAGRLLVAAEEVDGWIPIASPRGTPVAPANQRPLAALPMDDRTLRIDRGVDGSTSAVVSAGGDSIPVEYRIPNGYFLLGSFLQSRDTSVVLVLGTAWSADQTSDFLVVRAALEAEAAVSEVYRIPGQRWAETGAFGTVRLEGPSLYFMSTDPGGTEVVRYELPG